MNQPKKVTAQITAYKATVRGQYYANNERGKTSRFYRDVEVLLPKTLIYRDGYNRKLVRKSEREPEKYVYWPKIVSEPTRMNRGRKEQPVLGFIRKYLLNAALEEDKRYRDDFSGKHRTCAIVGNLEEVRVDADTPVVRDILKVKVEEMSIGELFQVIFVTSQPILTVTKH